MLAALLASQMPAVQNIPCSSEAWNHVCLHALHSIQVTTAVQFHYTANEDTEVWQDKGIQSSCNLSASRWQHAQTCAQEQLLLAWPGSAVTGVRCQQNLGRIQSNAHRACPSYLACSSARLLQVCRSNQHFLPGCHTITQVNPIQQTGNQWRSASRVQNTASDAPQVGTALDAVTFYPLPVKEKTANTVLQAPQI